MAFKLPMLPILLIPFIPIPGLPNPIDCDVGMPYPILIPFSPIELIDPIMPGIPDMPICPIWFMYPKSGC
jgi:hypothetical protein